MYPCYINNGGYVEVDFELCPKANQVDENFKMKARSMYLHLNITLEELNKWGQVVAKYCEPAKHYS
jgi:hypothetical protein